MAAPVAKGLGFFTQAGNLGRGLADTAGAWGPRVAQSALTGAVIGGTVGGANEGLRGGSVMRGVTRGAFQGAFVGGAWGMGNALSTPWGDMATGGGRDFGRNVSNIGHNLRDLRHGNALGTSLAKNDYANMFKRAADAKSPRLAAGMLKRGYTSEGAYVDHRLATNAKQAAKRRALAESADPVTVSKNVADNAEASSGAKKTVQDLPKDMGNQRFRDPEQELYLKSRKNLGLGNTPEDLGYTKPSIEYGNYQTIAPSGKPPTRADNIKQAKEAILNNYQTGGAGTGWSHTVTPPPKGRYR